MLSAVAEARRVLRSGGILLDIHPTDEPTHLEVWHARYHAQNRVEIEDPANLEAVHRVPVGELDHDETLQDFTAATDTLAEAMDPAEEHGFTLQRSTTFDYRYFFDSLDELTDYLEDNDEYAAASEQLLERALMVMQQAATKPKLVIVQRAIVTTLQKI
jgi:hypothetical protein